MKKSLYFYAKVILLPLGLGAISTLILYVLLQRSMMNSLEYTGLGLLLISTIYFFAGNFMKPRMTMVKEKPMESSMMMAEKDEILREREQHLSHQSRAILWGVIGFLYLAAPLLFWKG